jgi:hypothetical protein
MKTFSGVLSVKTARRLTAHIVGCAADSLLKATKTMQNYCVVMTACIDPAGGRIKVYRNDPETRLQDYLQALDFYLKLPDRRLMKIVFVDNSGYSLEKLKTHTRKHNKLNKMVEFHSLNCNAYPEGLHYGYAELDMLDKVFASSNLINNSEGLIKVTGRLKYPSIHKLLDKLPPNFDFAVDCRGKTPLSKYSHNWVTTQMMIFATHFYKTQIYKVAKLEFSSDISHLEVALFRRLIRFDKCEGSIYRWPINADPVGFAAHWNKNYRSPCEIIKNSVRAVSRRVIPHWWL